MGLLFFILVVLLFGSLYVMKTQLGSLFKFFFFLQFSHFLSGFPIFKIFSFICSPCLLFHLFFSPQFFSFFFFFSPHPRLCCFPSVFLFLLFPIFLFVLLFLVCSHFLISPFSFLFLFCLYYFPLVPLFPLFNFCLVFLCFRFSLIFPPSLSFWSIHSSQKKWFIVSRLGGGDEKMWNERPRRTLHPTAPGIFIAFSYHIIRTSAFT